MIEPRRFLTIRFAAVGGQLLKLVVLKLARHLAPMARDLLVEEVHGMAQKGGTVKAVLEVELLEPAPLPADTVLLGLERLEGARCLASLRPGACAFISSGVIRPPGTSFSTAPASTIAELEEVARELGVALQVVDAPGRSVWKVVQAALDAGAIP